MKIKREEKGINSMKKILAAVLAVVMVFQLSYADISSMNAKAADDLYASFATDLANGKNGYASSNQRQDKNYPVKVGNLTNGSTTGTNYIITHSNDNNPWFCVDLGSAQDINKVTAYQGAEASTYPNAYARSYVIEYSNYTGNLGGATTDENAAYIANNMTWTTAATVTGATLGSNTTVFKSVKTRYVRVRATQKAGTWASLYEMYVYGTDFSNAYNPNAQNTGKIRVLFIGNSLTEYNNVAGKVQDIFAHEGRTIEWDKLIQLGKSLEYHYSLPETGTTILNGNYDYVVLQDKASGFNGDTLMSGATKIYNSYISKTNAKVVMYSPWANESVLKSTQEYVTNSYMNVAVKYNAPIAPAGEAWFDLYYNYGYHWYADNIHATNVGSFVSANSIYYAISGVTTPVTYSANDNIIRTNNYDVNIANLIAERTCYYTRLANQQKAGYVSIARNYVQPSTTAPTPTSPAQTTAPVVIDIQEGEYTTGTAVDASVFASSANIARGRQAYASTAKQAASLAVDGNTNSRWESEFADPQWMYVDLGSSYDIAKVAVMWEGAYAKKYHIQVSDDAANWTTVKTVTANAVNTVEIDLGGASGRYVRMVGETRGTQYGYSIYEFGVWSTDAVESTAAQTQPQTQPQNPSDLYASYTTDLANGKNGYASSNQRQDRTYPAKVNNLTNGSTTGTNYIITHSSDTNPWFCVDLGSAQDINKVTAYQGAEAATYPNAYASSYVIEYSNYTGNLGGANADENAAYIADNMTWTTAATVTGAMLGSNTTVFNSVKTRYVRIRVTGKAGTWASMYEMYVYGTDFSKPYNQNEPHRVQQCGRKGSGYICS